MISKQIIALYQPKIAYKILISFFFTASFFIKSQCVEAQENYAPPSPQAMSLIAGTSSNVDLYTGRTSITIPIHTINNRSANVQVALKYTGSSGIKVQDIAGPVGLGWSLMAGGVITRMVRGKPDEDGHGYLEHGAHQSVVALSSDVNSSEFKNAVASNVGWDLNPDVFNSTIGGRIVFSTDQQPHFINEQGYKIIQNGMFSRDSTWILCDKQGTRYFFGKSPADREHSVLDNDPEALPSCYTSSWFISEIRSMDGASISFQYSQGTPVNYEYYQRTKQWSDNGWVNFSSPPPDSIVRSKVVDPVSLIKIVGDNETVSFDYIERSDISGAKALSAINLYNNLTQNLISKFVFETDYFKSQSVNPELRLKLVSVKQWNNQQSNNTLLAKFSYNETDNLPSRHSSKFDHWGYCNNNVSGQYFVSEGADKSANTEKAQSNILTSIGWPTGSSTQYVYGLNTYHKGNINYSGGGLRIEAVKQIDDAGNVLTTQYSYQNASGFSSGILHGILNETKGYSTSYLIYYAGPPFSYRDSARIERDVPISKLTDVDNINVGYSMVTITKPDNSKEVNYFQDYKQFPDGIYSYFHFTNNYFDGFHPEYASTYQGFSYFTSNNLKRGLLIRKDIFNSLNEVVKSTGYQYNYTNGIIIYGSQSIYNGTDIIENTASSQSDFFVGSVYREIVTTCSLTNINDTTYTPSGHNLISTVAAQNTFKSGAWPFLLSRQSVTQSDGTILNTDYNYASDILPPDQSGMSSLLYAANIMTPLETIQSVTRGGIEQVTGAKITTYQSVGSDLLLPSQTLTLKIGSPVTDYQHLSKTYIYDSRMKPDHTYIFHADGQLLQAVGNDGIPVSNLWGYNKQYPIAKVTNATKDQIAYGNCEEIVDGDDEINNSNIFFSNNSASLFSTDCKTGHRSYRLIDGNYMETVGQLPVGHYIISYWSKGGQMTFDDYYTFNNVLDGSADSNGWSYHQATFTITANDYFEMYPDGSGTPILVDDIRIYPEGAQMITCTYEPGVGISSQTDANGIITYYEYDGFNRLMNIKDYKGNIIKNYLYNTISK